MISGGVMVKNKRIVKILHGVGCPKHDNCFTCEFPDCNCSESHNRKSNQYMNEDEIVIDNKPVYKRI